MTSEQQRSIEYSLIPNKDDYFVKELFPGMGQAVAERTYLRKKNNGAWETWSEVAERVSLGNASLLSLAKDIDKELDIVEEELYERETLYKHIASGALPTAGRHLQHGDLQQKDRNMEVFTNCSSSATSFNSFHLLLNGSGVGRGYDDDLMLVNYDNMPKIRCVISDTHPDFVWGVHESVREAKHRYGNGTNVRWFEVEDSREGWAKAFEIIETATFEKINRDKLFVFDFSKVRPKGAPIGGMQNRPSSGPIPTMAAFDKVYSIKGAGLDPWEQAMFVDHFLAECVVVGGARRAARMATKYWKDEKILDFIRLKRPIEYRGLVREEIHAFIEKHGKKESFLWSSNNSVAVDKEFWDCLNDPKNISDKKLVERAEKVFEAACEAGYFDGTGEPGFINIDRLSQKNEGWNLLKKGDFIGSRRYQVSDETQIYLQRLSKRARAKDRYMIVNPCSEIPLSMLGAFCTIADVAPYHCETLEDAKDALRAAVRFLMRVNLMDSVYNKEVKRTNRIGVGLTGVHEFAWKFFKYGFKDLIDEKKSQDFWDTLADFNKTVRNEAIRYAKVLGTVVPHTSTTVKPSGTISKLFGITEGWHLPSMKQYLRWVQFRSDDPQVHQYKVKGYPTRDLLSYSGTTIVGFPTEPVICTLGMGSKLVTAAEATPEEQFTWLQLGEKYWIDGTVAPEENYGGQISYTLKYYPNKVDYETFKRIIREQQSKVKCCSVMPQEDTTSYEYQPEEPISRKKFDEIVSQIESGMQEDISIEHIDCATGACPVDFKGNK